MNHEFPVDMCGNNLVPSLQHIMSLEDSSDDTCDREPEMVVSDNGDTDYDLNDESEEEIDDEEEDSCEDDSQVQALVDHLEVKFRDLVSSKIVDAEQFFDDPNTLQRPLSRSTLVDAQNSSATQEFLSHTSQEELRDGGSAKQGVIVENSQGGGVHANYITVATQTEDSVSGSSDPGSATPIIAEIADEIRTEEVRDSEHARMEIGQLREARECLITQRQKYAAQLKEEEKSEEYHKTVECKVFEFEEGIEAVDLAIEFKNEIILGHPKRAQFVSGASSESDEPDLVSRLQNLSVDELQRLLCIYFGKVVELRSTSKKLELHLEHSENTNEQLKQRLAAEHKFWKNVHTENQARIRLMLSSQNHSSVVDTYFREMESQLAVYRKKKHDLERSLTELLVRHGYLVNGADYDVKQVVKMLGIESQLTGVSNRPSDDNPGGTVRHFPHHSRSKPPLNLRRNARLLDDELPRIHREARLLEGWDREHRQSPLQPPQGAEVRRERKRLIIQPGNAASSSVYAPHGGQSHHHGHNSHQNPHRSSHGSNHHGHK